MNRAIYRTKLLQKEVLDTKEFSQIIAGNRIPKDFFVTCGIGESDITVHAGSYHLALRQADIEPYNIMVYSSTLPAIANQVEKPDNLVHGAVMETIMACANSEKGKRATAGIIFAWLYNKLTGKKRGGFVCEYNGDLPEDEARDQLKQSLNELYTNGYAEEFELRDLQLISRSFVPKKKYGTALCALCFVNHAYPIQKIAV